MAGEVKTTDGGTPSPESAVKNLPTGTPSVPAPNVPVGESAAELAAQYGGRPTGRGRADGLTPGSPEAVQVDRDRDAKRKREQRASRAKLLGGNPRPIPSAVQPESPVIPTTGTPADLLPAANAALVLWCGTDLEDVCRELIAALQAWRTYAREKKLELAKLPPAVVTELMKDAAWSERLVKVIYESGSRILAKLLNKSGVSAQNKDEVICAGACIALAVSDLRFNSKMNKVIALQMSTVEPVAKAA